MIVMTSTAAEAALQPYFQVINRVVDGAWKDWRDNPLAPQMQHKRVRATCVWNQLIARSRREFADDPTVRVTTMKEWEGLLFDDRIFVRFKKAPRDLISRNYPTKHALAYNDLKQDLFDGVSRLDLVYVLDASETLIDRICIVQRDGDQVVWRLDVKGVSGDEAQNVLPFPPVPPSGTPVADRVLKSKRKQERNDAKEQLGGDS